jgi:hypothetical protein
MGAVHAMATTRPGSPGSRAMVAPSIMVSFKSRSYRLLPLIDACVA